MVKTLSTTMLLTLAKWLATIDEKVQVKHRSHAGHGMFLVLLSGRACERRTFVRWRFDP
jgi:hypothetical protein